MMIQLIDEQLAEITRNDLKENYEVMFVDYITCIKTKQSVNFYSSDYKEEKKEFEKLLKSFREVMKFYGITDIKGIKQIKKQK